MILCKNGHPNPEGSTYCRVCRVYIDADARRVEPEPAPPPAEPQAPPSPPQSEAASPIVSLSEMSLNAPPGGEASCEVRLQNPGAVADEYTVEVVGEASEWALVDPWHLSLAPGAVATAWATFRPDAAAAPGKAVPFQVTVTSKLLLDRPVSALGVLQLAAAPSPPSPPTPPSPAPAQPLPPRETAMASVKGVVRKLDQRVEWRSASEKPLTIFTFRVECQDEAGVTTAVVPVEMRAVSFRGGISEGDTVEIDESWKPGQTLELRRVSNITTGAWFGAKPRRHLMRKLFGLAVIGAGIAAAVEYQRLEDLVHNLGG